MLRIILFHIFFVFSKNPLAVFLGLLGGKVRKSKKAKKYHVHGILLRQHTGIITAAYWNMPPPYWNITAAY
jgi:hypothetical protein